MSRLADWFREMFGVVSAVSVTPYALAPQPDEVHVLWPPTNLTWTTTGVSDLSQVTLGSWEQATGGQGLSPEFIDKLLRDRLPRDPYVWIDPWEGR